MIDVNLFLKKEKQLHQIMEKHKLDSILITTLPNLNWLTNGVKLFTPLVSESSKTYLLLQKDGAKIMFAPSF